MIDSFNARNIYTHILTVQFDIVLEKLWLRYIYLFIWRKNKKKTRKKRKQINLPQQTHTTNHVSKITCNFQLNKKSSQTHTIEEEEEKKTRIKINIRQRHILSGLYLRFHACQVYFYEVLNITISYFFFFRLTKWKCVKICVHERTVTWR